MFHACVQRFDGMDEKIFGGELNRALLIFLEFKLIIFLKLNTAGPAGYKFKKSTS